MNESSGPFRSQTSEPIEFNCHFCQRRLKVGSQLALQQAKCPSCNQVVNVPAITPRDADDLARDSNPTIKQQNSFSDLENRNETRTPNELASPEFFDALAVSNAASSTPPSPASPESAKIEINSGRLLSEQSTSSAENPPSRVKTEEQGADTPIRRLYTRITQELNKIFVGQDDLVLGSLVALFSGGHVLIESVPGLGKTLFVRALGRVLGCQFGRIQFTADLMPSDITGSPIFNMKNQDFEFRPGPVFTQLLLADEINRAPAKTHAALLEIMQERRVTVDGTTHKLAPPFLVMATQNPIESEGTYNLPEAQLDRFMFKLRVDYPTAEQEMAILLIHGGQADVSRTIENDLQQVTHPAEIQAITEQTAAVHVDHLVIDYINRIVRRTRHWPQFYIGASPRAGICLLQAIRTLAAFRGRDYAVPDDVVEIVLPTLRHRVVMTAETEVEGYSVDELLIELLRQIEVPRLR